MGKTYKKTLHGRRYYRRMRGNKKALINKVRYKAIPPNPWSADKLPDDLCFMPDKIARKMWRQGYPEYYVIERIQKKFNLVYLDAYKITGFYFRPEKDWIYWWAGRDQDVVVPEGAVKVWKTKRYKEKKKY
jgi:hypothetical protein